MSAKTLLNTGKYALSLNSNIKNNQNIINESKKIRQGPKNLKSKYEIYTSSNVKLFDDRDDDINKDESMTLIESKSKTNINRRMKYENSTITDIKNEIIEEANKILNERLKNRGLSLTSRPKGKCAFITDTKEVSLKNYLIDKLKEERTILNEKELTIQDDLKQSEFKLQNDMSQFNYYVEREKDTIKQGESDLLQETQKRKHLSDQRNELIKERKQLLDDIERNIKNINNLKNISDFVNKLMGINLKSINKINPLSFNENISSNSFGLINSESKLLEAKERKLEEQTMEILNEFKLNGSNIQNTKDILSDPNRLLVKFSEMEEKILKMIEKKEEQEKEINRIKELHKQELNHLIEHEKSIRNERKKIEEEFKKDEKNLEQLRKRLNDGGDNKLYNDKLKEIYKETHPKEKKEISDNECIKLIMDYLKVKENSIKEKIYTLGTYPKQQLLEQAERRKDKNKEISRKENQEKKKVENERKNQKARERMNRIVIKGRNKMTHFKPKDEARNLSIDDKKNSNDNNMLLLFSD